MASTFTWLDHSEEQRRRVLDVLSLFKEKGTVDELGVGTIRDALADILFPGTSSPQTRARYFFFIPWNYLQLEAEGTPSAEVAKKAQRAELRLIERLLASGETDGVIGRLSRSSLQRLPSNIYWSGLRRLGICLYSGSQDGYHKSLDAHYRKSRATSRTDDGEVLRAVGPNWHRGLPKPPGGFPAEVSLMLTPVEGEYLRDRIATAAPGSLFAHVVSATKSGDTADYPWGHPRFEQFSAAIRGELEHARNFSEMMHGAVLLYNLLVAELVPGSEYVDKYRQDLAAWADELTPRMSVLMQWRRAEFWACVESEGARISLPTRAFVERWWDLVLGSGSPTDISHSEDAREAVRRRERLLKGPLARAVEANTRARERWSGESGTARLTYRWPNAVRIAKDILLAREQAHA